MLSRRQAELLEFLDNSIRLDGACPSHEEIRDALGLSSKSQVHRLVGILEEKGFLKRLPGRSRSIAILRSHASAPEPCYTEGQVSLMAAALICNLGRAALPAGRSANDVARELLEAAFAKTPTMQGTRKEAATLLS